LVIDENVIGVIHVICDSVSGLTSSGTPLLLKAGQILGAL